MNSLADLEHELATLLGGEEQASWDVIEKLILAVNAKRDAFAAYILDLEDRARLIRSHVSGLEKRARVMENRAEHLKRLAAQVMKSHNKDKLEGVTHTMTLMEGRQRLVIDDPREVPDQYKRIEQVVDVFTHEVKRILEAGQDVRGAHLERGPDTVRVYM